MQFSYRHTFAKVATITYGSGLVAHILNLAGILPVQHMLQWMHAIVGILAGYSGIGFIYYIRKVPLKNMTDRIVYNLIIFHLNISAILHAYSIITNSNNWIQVFPDWWSYAALFYFGAFGYYSFRLHFRLNPGWTKVVPEAPGTAS